MSEPSGTDARLDRIEELMQDNQQLKNSLMLISVAWDQALRRRDATEAKLTKAVEVMMTAQEYIDDLESHEGAEGFSLSTKVLGDSYYAALAEMEGK